MCKEAVFVNSSACKFKVTEQGYDYYAFNFNVIIFKCMMLHIIKC